MKNIFTSSNILIILATVLLTGAIIYLTPLKHKNIIEPAIDDILPTEFYELYKQNPDDYIFIDVRSVNAYNDIHAADSINMPLHTLFDQRKNLPKNGKTIVLICTGGRASGVGYSYLEHFGFLNLRRIEGGISAWDAVDLPVIVN
ncbi:rhodanese-like domain-containing protein [Candidatus Kaiserbacteria bacterium]|nr:rhodanese-like domain-containing protein [Candidatus Kaiserbacteria bacterium]